MSSPLARTSLLFATLGAGGAACGLSGAPADPPPGGKADDPGSACGSLARLEPAFPELAFSQPVALAQHPHNQLRWYVVERSGTISTFLRTLSGTSEPRVFADLGDRVAATPDEAGLLGLAFHPRFDENGLVFLSYTAPSESAPGGIESRISRVESFDRGRTAALETEVVLLRVEQPFENHNGGHIAFGPDGFLYVGLGDGGSAGDPLGLSQDPQALLGKLLRIDVDREDPGRALPYAIPPDNPFAAGGGAPEVFALGLRNPWRFSFDRVTGELWVADVGQDAFEEVNLVEAGANYGWPVREGARCFAADEEACAHEGLTDPRGEYGRDLGISVTGGHVYRGEKNPSLAGRYLFADFGSGRFMSLDPAAGPDLVQAPQVLFDTFLHPSSFAEDSAGEIYVLDYRNGLIFELVAGGECPEPPPRAPLGQFPTFGALYDHLLSLRCSPCHTLRAMGGLSLTDPDAGFDALIGVAAATDACAGRTRVIPGDPESSLLFQKVSGIDLCGQEMPPEGGLDPAEVEAIRAWIASGAPR